MARQEILNNVDHKDLRILTHRSAELGDNVMSVFAFPNEFRNLQAHYPIMFQKAPDTGKFFAVALLGLQQDENLFLTEEGWDCSYIPLMMKRGPFSIGRQKDRETGEEKGVISVDMDHPRVSKGDEGEPVFLEFGGYTDYLEEVTKVLDEAHDGYQVNEPFMDSLLKQDLLEPMNLEITLADGSSHRLVDLYAINEEKLMALDGPTLEAFSKSGVLSAIYMVVASLSQVQKLVDRKNASHMEALG